ncbi:MAG: transcription-repair coupling factor, partial [Rugosibacter sp.]|nr:transcription-repair coupling factor [Rugosibacter sp.]
MNSLLSLPAQPKPGQRLDLPSFSASIDALAMAQLARPGHLLTVITASPLEAQRLVEEIAWFAPQLRAHLLPDWETLPYDHFSPHQDLVSERLATLHAVSRNECDVLITAASTAITRLAPPSFLAGHTFFMKKGDRLDIDKLRAQLTLAGYAHVTQVVAAGEYSVRGGLIDLFPMGTPLPYRIELFDDEIETLRSFDVDTQRTLYPVPDIRLLPAREFPAGDAGRTTFRQRFRETFEGDASRISLYKDVSNGILPAGIEYYLPLFFDATATLFDYLPAKAQLILHGDVTGAIAEFWTDTAGRYKMLGGDRSRPVLPPQALFLRDEEFFIAANNWLQWTLKAEKVGTGETPSNRHHTLPPLAVERKADDPVANLRNFLASQPRRVLLLAESPGRRETLHEYLTTHQLSSTACADFAEFLLSDHPLMLCAGPLSGGFLLDDIALITENELYAATARPRTRRGDTRRANLEGWLRDLSELSIGDPVVHEQHG